MKHIHFIGICGSGMGSLAGLCKEAGFTVTGPDTACYPPMSDQLQSLGISVQIGYDAKNLLPKPDLVVIGNVVRKDNPEAVAVMAVGIPYKSLPQALTTLFLEEKKTLMVTGTHGKTTTSHLLAWVLETAGSDPGFLIGGVGNNAGKSYQKGSGPFFVVEGDEYDTAFFDKGPKFLHYKPAGLILTSVEWDHVDIYPNFENLKGAFRKLIVSLPPACVLVACEDSPVVGELVADAPCRVIRYGLTKGDCYASDIFESPEGSRFKLHDHGKIHEFRFALTGRQNIENAVGVWCLARAMGITEEKIAEAFLTFKGVKKRQEFIGEVKEVVVLSDFAHHPTAIRRTLEGVKAKYPGRRLWAIFEPRSNTSRRNHHYNDLLEAFGPADRIIIADVYQAEKIPAAERLNVAKLADELMCKKGKDAYNIAGSDFILEYIVRGICAKDVVLFMSNGDFDNLPYTLLQKLERRKIYSDRKQVRPIKVRE